MPVLPVQNGKEKEYCKNRQARVDCCQTLKTWGRIIALLRMYRCLAKSFGGKEVPTGTCPECDADVHVDTDTDKGESVSCEECGVELEVVGLDPVELDIVEEDDLDDDDEDEEF